MKGCVMSPIPLSISFMSRAIQVIRFVCSAIQRIWFICRAIQIAIWVGFVGAAVLGLHLVLALLARLRGWHLPTFLEFPRLELFVAPFLASPVAQTAGREHTFSGTLMGLTGSRALDLKLCSLTAGCDMVKTLC